MEIRLQKIKRISSLNYHTKFNANKKKKKLSKGLIKTGQLSFAPSSESSQQSCKGTIIKK